MIQHFLGRVPLIRLLPLLQFLLTDLRFVRLKFGQIMLWDNPSQDSTRLITKFQGLREIMELCPQCLVNNNSSHIAILSNLRQSLSHLLDILALVILSIKNFMHQTQSGLFGQRSGLS
jgi:hypothetical protein